MSKHNRQSKNDLLIFELTKDPNYRIYENGRIQTKIQKNGKLGENWRDAGGSHTPDGYLVLRYKGVSLRIHRIIWAKFHNYLNPSLIINHLDGCKFNNQLSNLELTTDSLNQKHAYKIGAKKVQRGGAKLTWAQVDDIRKDRSEGMTLRELKAKYCASKTALSYVCSGKTYREDLRDDEN